MHILFLSQWFPFPANNGSKIRIYNLLQGLAQVHDVTLLSFYDPKEPAPDPSVQYPFCSHVRLVPWKAFDPRSGKAALGFFSQRPRSITDTYSVEMEALITDLVSSGSIDVIVASQLTMASYYPAFGKVPAIFEEIELGLFVDQAHQSGHWMTSLRRRLTWLKLRSYISRLLDSYAACTVVSEPERANFVKHLPRHAHKVAVLQNCVSVEDEQGRLEIDRHRIIFAGSFRFQPNYHAMQWFVGEVFPLVLQKVPDAHLWITGDHASLPLPATKNITLAGYVDDVRSLIASSAVSVAPIWSGGGTRLKILEAMSLGTPVIATSKGAEGLGARPEEHILIADDPQLFADHVVRLLCDDELRNSISANALQFIKDHYDWKKLMPLFLSMLDKAVSS